MLVRPLPRQAAALIFSIITIVAGSALAADDVAAQTPANEEPQFPSSETGSRSVAENTSADVDIGAPVAATDADNDSLTYSLGGDDASSFDIVESSGQLRTYADLDYETKSTYSLTVSVHDGKDSDSNPDTTIDDTIAVTVAVTNSDEAGAVQVSPAGLRVNFVLRARLSDPDGGVRSVSWRWASSEDGNDWDNISGATGPRYTPRNPQAGRRLRVTATYRDAQGSGKVARAVLEGVVAEREGEPDLYVSTWVSGLSIPWGIAFAPDGTMLFTKRSGVISARLTDGTVNTVTADLADLHESAEAGLMAIVVDPDFTTNRRFYTCQAHTGRTVQVIAWTIDDEFTAATRAADPLVGDIPGASYHSGCRLRFGPQGSLWIATGDASGGTNPQDLSSLGGKILRVDASTGAGAVGNPFTAAPLVYTYGHRNLQGLALRPGTNQMWSVEHGPTIDDEINLLVSGGNYGWDPVPGYNQSVPMTDLVKYPDAVEAKWSSGSPTIATSGGIFIEGDEWGVWEGRLAVASLKNRTLRLFDFADDGTLLSELVVTKLSSQNSRLRTPMMGPDGALYISTSDGGNADKILRVTPHQPPVFEDESITVEVAENSAIGTVIATIAASDPNHHTLTYSLGGPDAASFAVTDTDSGGQVTVAASPDYEAKSSFEVELTATDPTRRSDSVTLVINVTDVDEAGMLRLSSPQPEAGVALTAAVEDPDSGVSSVTWRWERSTDQVDWSVISGSESAAYTPVAADEDYFLRITASYRDGHGPGKTAQTTPPHAVRAPPVSNHAPEFPFTRTVARSVAENTRFGTAIGSPVGAGDADGDVLTYTLEGPDGRSFHIDAASGQLRVDSALDHEARDTYTVTVTASDPSDASATTTVTITDVDEDGELALSPKQPRVGEGLTAALSDPDRDPDDLLAGVVWEWERSADESNWHAIRGPGASRYTARESDLGHWLRVTATYTDAHGPSKVAQAVTAAVSPTAAAAAAEEAAAEAAEEAEAARRRRRRRRRRR